MICPTCGIDFANLGGHKCKVVTNIEELKKLWNITATVISLGEPTNPKTECGMFISGNRNTKNPPTDKNKKPNFGFSALVMDGDLKGLNYISLDTKPTEAYRKEIENIVTNWREFTEAKFPTRGGKNYDLCDTFTSLDNVTCCRCGSRHVPGISGGGGGYNGGAGYHLCIGCMLLSISWIVGSKEKASR